MIHNNRYSNLFIKIDRAIDTWCPVVSTFTNAGHLIGKAFLQPSAENLSNRYARHLNRKSASRCAVLMLPILGNIAVKLYDVLHEKWSEKRDDKECTPLINAAKEGNARDVEELIQKEANLQACDKQGFTALMWAADKNHTAIVDRLLQANADTEMHDDKGRTALMWAAQRGNLEVMQALIEAGADLEARDNEGRTVLIRAAMLGKQNVVKALIKAQADLNACDHEGQTALMWAAESGHIPVMEALLEQPQVQNNLEIRDKHGHTALDYAVTSNRSSFEKREMVETLIQKGANTEAFDHHHYTPLARAMILNDHSGVIDVLRDQGANEDYAKEFVGRKFLANFWGVDGQSVYTDPNDPTKPKVTFKLEGFYKSYAITTLSRYVTDFFQSDASNSARQHITQQSQTAIEEAVQNTFMSSSSPTDLTVADVRRRINENKPVMILGGSSKHAIAMVIHNNQLIVCNRGEGKLMHAVKYYNLPKEITEDLIKKLLQEYPTTLKFQLMLLRSKLKYSHGYIQKDQTVGNCVLASMKSAIGVLMIAYTARDEIGKTKKERRIGRKLYKDFTRFARDKSVREYLETSQNQDVALLQKIKKKAKKKKLLESNELLKKIPNPSFWDRLPLTTKKKRQ